MPFEWTSDLETGYPSIDEQHKQLFASLNDLLSACRHGGHRAELKKTLDFLVAYTLQHFADEEEFQRTHNYPDYERHKLLHDNFKLVAADLAERLIREGPTVALVAEAHSTVGDWLVSHIKGEDLMFALHAREQS